MLAALTTFLKRPFVRRSAGLQAGALFSTGINVLASIVFARFLGVHDYGAYAIFGALVGVLTIFTDAGSDLAGTTKLSEAYARQDAVAVRNTVGAYLKATAFALVGAGFIVGLLAPWIAGRWYGDEVLGQYARWWLLGNAFLGTMSFLALILQAQNTFRRLVSVEAGAETMKVLVKVLFVVAGFGVWGIAVGHALASLAVGSTALLIYAAVARRDVLLPRVGELWRVMREAPLKGFLSFSILISLEKNLGNLLGLLPVLFLGKFAPPAVAGFYKIAFSYAALPLVALSGVSRLLGVTFPQSLAEGVPVLRRKFLQSSLWSGLLLLAILAPAALVAPLAVRVAYGTEYFPVVKIIYPLILAMAPLGFTVGFGSLFRTLGKVRISLVLNTSYIVGATVLALALYPRFSALHTTLIVIACWYYIGGFITFLLSLKYLREAEERAVHA